MWAGPIPTIIPKGQPSKHITYVLSAHGKGVTRDMFTLPKNFFIHTYVPPGKQLACSLAEPNKICVDPTNARGHYKPGTVYTNDVLYADTNKKKAFYSGVKDCSTNEIILNIDKLATTDMKYVVNAVNQYHNSKHPGDIAHLHCLYCRDSAGGARSRRRRNRRKMTRTRRRIVKE
jgi:hypothetical protein